MKYRLKSINVRSMDEMLGNSFGGKKLPRVRKLKGLDEMLKIGIKKYRGYKK